VDDVETMRVMEIADEWYARAEPFMKIMVEENFGCNLSKEDQVRMAKDAVNCAKLLRNECLLFAVELAEWGA